MPLLWSGLDAALPLASHVWEHCWLGPENTVFRRGCRTTGSAQPYLSPWKEAILASLSRAGPAATAWMWSDPGLSSLQLCVGHRDTVSAAEGPACMESASGPALHCVSVLLAQSPAHSGSNLDLSRGHQELPHQYNKKIAEHLP